MPIKVKCRCGRVLKVRDSMAGKRVRCPDCESPVNIPKPKPKPQPVYDDFDEFGEAEDDDPYAAPPPRKRKKPGKKKSKSSGGGVPVPLLIGGCIFAGLIGVGATAYVFLSRENSTPTTDSVAATDNESQNSDQASAATTSSEQDAGTVAQTDDESFRNGGSEAQEEAPEVSSTDDSPTMEAPAAAMPTSAPAADGGLWVVLSNFREATPAGSNIKTYQIDYRVVSGSPSSGREYVVYVGSPMGMMERYNEVDINLSTNGTVEVPGGIMMSNRTKAYVALKQGRQKWKALSGEIKLGGPPTAPKRPPTVTEAAGTAAQGKLFALANARFENSRGRKALVVDYVLQGTYEADKRYYLVAKGTGEPVTADISMSLMRATPGKTSQFGIRLLPTRSFPKGPLTIHVEKGTMFRRNGETPEIVSNTTTLQQ